MRVTLNDIAAKVGVTKTAVSLALRGSPGVSKEVREKIRRVAAEMGYVSDPILRRLTAYRHGQETDVYQSRIVWINRWPAPERLRSYHEFDQYWRGARLASKRLGYQVEEFVWGENLPGSHAEQLLLQRGVLGLLIPPHPPGIDWSGFDWGKFSLMRFGLSVQQIRSNLVTADHQRAMVMAVQKIHEYGYRKIGLVYNEAHDLSMGGNHFGGFMWACRQLGGGEIIPPLNSETRTPAWAAASKRNLSAWMNKFRPDAILTTAPETPVFLRELGCRIPRDVAVASTSPYDISVDAGVDQCPNAIGQIAAEMLIKQISLNERGTPDVPSRILIESRWQEGKSLPPRNGNTAL